MANLPLLVARGESIPEAWENSVLELYQHGLRYKRADPADKGGVQVGARMTIEIFNPDSNFFTHKCENGMTAGAPGTFEYIMEFLGAKDTWIKKSEEAKEWDYTYHQRLASYEGGFDQIEFIINRLVERPFQEEQMLLLGKLVKIQKQKILLVCKKYGLKKLQMRMELLI